MVRMVSHDDAYVSYKTSALVFSETVRRLRIDTFLITCSGVVSFTNSVLLLFDAFYYRYTNYSKDVRMELSGVWYVQVFLVIIGRPFV
jgi:hypothetical protein